MNAAIGAILIQLWFCVSGLAVSVWMERDRPPTSSQRTSSRRRPQTLLGRLPLIGVNLAMVSLLLPGAVWLLEEKFPVSVPSVGVCLTQLAIVFVCDDFCFYWAHRAMHQNKWLYRHVHKIHHEAAAPVPIEFIYVHPLEALAGGVGVTLGLTVALLAFGEMSAWTLWSALALRLLHELHIHSGLPSILGAYIPFFGVPEHHARHHEKPTTGNYASTFTFWDRFFGTESNHDREAALQALRDDMEV